jgi:hypothetical protein
MRTLLLTITLAIVLPVQQLAAQPSQTELSQQAANPIADLMSVPMQNNTDFGLGPYDRASNVLNVQPVIPLAGGKLITRTIVPFVWIPDVAAENGLVSSGLSDISFTSFCVPSGAPRSGAPASRGSSWHNRATGHSACSRTTSGPTPGPTTAKR